MSLCIEVVLDFLNLYLATVNGFKHKSNVYDLPQGHAKTALCFSFFLPYFVAT